MGVGSGEGRVERADGVGGWCSRVGSIRRGMR